MRTFAVPPLIVLTAAFAASASVRVESPDGRIAMEFAIEDREGLGGALWHTAEYGGEPVILPSPIRLGWRDAPPVAEGLRIVSADFSSNDTAWTPVYGERATVRDRCNRASILVEETAPPGRRFEIRARVYNEGAAFCFAFPEGFAGETAVLEAERVEYRFAEDCEAWATYSAQGLYEKVPLSGVKPGCERPLVVRVRDSLYAALGEARLVDHARAKFDPIEDGTGVVTALAGPVEFRPPHVTPWRLAMFAESPGELLENNDIFLTLNEPCAIGDVSWIRPGKAIREVTLTTEGGKACVDFAVRNHLQFVEYDAGWYGHEYGDSSDAATVDVDPERSPGPLDLGEVIRYAEERGIGVRAVVKTMFELRWSVERLRDCRLRRELLGPTVR